MGKKVQSPYLYKERYRQILAAVVKEYISKAEPVSSKVIAVNYPLGLSPATVRNIMSRLEDDGFLLQPHTSAGRIPTEKCFRFYLDHLLEPEELMDRDKGLLTMTCANTVEDFGRVTKALSSLTGCAGLVLIQRKDNFTIKQIRLLPIDRTRVMVVVVSDQGNVMTRLSSVGPHGKFDLEKMSNYLNSIGEGLTVKLLKDRVIGEMKKEKNLYDELLRWALKLVSAVVQADPGGTNDLYVEGKVKILEQPEFRDNIKRMKKLFAAFEEKSLLVKMLDKGLEEDGVHVYLGSESLAEFEGLSFVTAPYAAPAFSGTLGVLGPVRMNYSRIVPLVLYTAGLLNRTG